MYLLLSLFVSLLKVSNSVQYIDCTGILSCTDTLITCNGDEDCFIDCTGLLSSCFNAIINCPQNAHQCRIECNGEGACQETEIYGGYGDLIINGYGVANLWDSTINCPVLANCNIESIGLKNNLAQSTINANNSNQLNIIASSEGTDSEDTLWQSTIICPYDNIHGSQANHVKCNIHISGNAIRMMDEMKIYAVESFNTVNIVCNATGNGECIGTLNPDDQPIIFCKSDYSANCSFISNADDLSMKSWECVDDTNICNNYLLPTYSPTDTPKPTNYPTYKPTKYNPDYPPNILYVSLYGCDYGYCQSDYVNYNIYCNNKWFYNNSDNNYFSYCCNDYNLNEPTNSPVSSQIIPDECTNQNIIEINNDKLFINTQDYTNHDPHPFCFKLANEYICNNPIISFNYDTIYASKDTNLYISYKNTSNYISSGPCVSDVSLCDVQKSCFIHSQPNDSPWNIRSGIQIIFVTIPIVMEAELTHLCSGSIIQGYWPEIGWPQLNVSVTCSPFISSTCTTMNYVWNCFNGNDGYPNNCSFDNTGYDGNGKIMIDEGVYEFNHNIYIIEKQIIIEGSGKYKTILNHSTIDNQNNIKIHCQSRECYFTMKNLNYFAQNKAKQIKIINSGNGRFKSVIFNSVDFYFSDYSSITFTDCIFRESVFFNITNNAIVSFIACNFTTNKISLNIFEIDNNAIVSISNDTLFYNNYGNTRQTSIINTKNSEISISQTIFFGNNGINSIINNMNDENGTILITDSIFRFNTNISYLIHSMNSNGISRILNTKIDLDNECNNECIGRLFIGKKYY